MFGWENGQVTVHRISEKMAKSQENMHYSYVKKLTLTNTLKNYNFLFHECYVVPMLYIYII